MLQSLMMFLAPVNASQATPISPPAVARPAEPPVQRQGKLRFGASVLANTVGCSAIFAACWFSVQLLQMLITQ